MKGFTLIIAFVLIITLIAKYFNEQFKYSGNERFVGIISKSDSLVHPAVEISKSLTNLNNTNAQFQYATITLCNNNYYTTNSVLDLSYLKGLLSNLMTNIQTIIQGFTGDEDDPPSNSVMYEEDLIAHDTVA